MAKPMGIPHFFVKSMRKSPEIGGRGPSCFRAPRVRKMRPVRAARLRGCWWPVLGATERQFHDDLPSGKLT